MKRESLEEKIIEVLKDKSPMNFSDLWFELVPVRQLKVEDKQSVLAAVNSLLKAGKVILGLAPTEKVGIKISGGTDWYGSNEFAISLPQIDKPRRS